MKKLLPFFLSCVSGILLSLPWIAEGWEFALFFAFVPLFWVDEILINSNSENKTPIVFLYAYLSFLIWNIVTCWWIGYVSVAGMLFVASMNALLMTTVWCLRYRVSLSLGISSGLFSLVVFWLSYEFISHYGLLPWPWLILGNGLANSVKLIQWYEFSGVLGGSLWILIVNIILFQIIRKAKCRIVSYKYVVLLFSIISIPAILSLITYSRYSEKGEIQNVLILQPNINPYTEKFSGLSDQQQVQRLVDLTESKMSDSINMVLAPETAIPIMKFKGNLPTDTIILPFNRIIKKYPKSYFITGAITQYYAADSNSVLTTNASSENYNSSLLIDTSLVVQVSHKNILVAGVEKEPFQEYLPFLPDVLIELGGMKGSLNSGKDPGLFTTSDNVKIGSVICFESVFGTYVRQVVNRGANYLVVLTNDGWWKESYGVSQHFCFSRIRAIETRRSIVRSANTGISGTINQRGDIVSSTNLNSLVSVVSQIKTNDALSFYVMYGNYIGLISLLLSGLTGIFFIYRSKGNKRA